MTYSLHIKMFCSFQTSGNCSKGLWPQLEDGVSILCSHSCPSAQPCWHGAGVRQSQQRKSAGGLPIGWGGTGHSTAPRSWWWIFILIPTFSGTPVEGLAARGETGPPLVFSAVKTLTSSSTQISLMVSVSPVFKRLIPVSASDVHHCPIQTPFGSRHACPSLWTLTNPAWH